MLHVARFVTNIIADGIRVYTQATELDPAYSKAWSRLAAAQEVHISHTRFSSSLTQGLDLQALELYPSAMKSYQLALDTLPKESLKPAELTSKKQYETALEAVTLKQQNLEAARNRPRQQPTREKPFIQVNSSKKMPWVVANEMIPNLRLKENYFSSVSVHDLCFETMRNSCL